MAVLHLWSASILFDNNNDVLVYIYPDVMPYTLPGVSVSLTDFLSLVMSVLKCDTYLTTILHFGPL